VASANLHSATALVGFATANRLPVISLTADLGSSPANLANLFSPPTLFFTLADTSRKPRSMISHCIIGKRPPKPALEQADAHRSTVITAFQNVADTLRALRADTPLKAATAAETEAHKSLEIKHKRLLLEEVNYVALLLWHVCRRKPTDTCGAVPSSRRRMVEPASSAQTVQDADASNAL
jgi:hypothetical protein